mgnify:CR=1 FL=1
MYGNLLGEIEMMRSAHVKYVGCQVKKCNVKLPVLSRFNRSVKVLKFLYGDSLQGLEYVRN